LNLLLDTHAFLWLMFGDPRLGPKQLQSIEHPERTVHVSSVSIFEIANKVRIGKLPMTGKAADALANICEEFSFRRLDLTIRHAQVAGLLPCPHRDPFDRMLAAQAIIEDMQVMTVDAQIAALGAKVVW
jgi:PIN domain nuclease of toxin-antitoxin system